MVKTRSMTRDHNDDDDASSSSSSRKRFKTFDNNGVAPWSDLNDDMVNLVMTQLGVIDFLAFSGVCKSWRSLTHSKRNWFMASRPPMSMRIGSRGNYQDSYIYLKDFEGRMFRKILPNSVGRKCFGLTCGYLILFSRKTRDFWLVNPITRHELHFPDYTFDIDYKEGVKAILVFSPSISGCVLVVLYRTTPSYTMGDRHVTFSIEGKRGWNCVSSTLPILDLHTFKGKIYILDTHCSLGELRLHPIRKQKWSLLETKKFTAPDLVRPELVSSGENLYLISIYPAPEKVLQLDFGEMKWVLPEKTIGEYAFFYSTMSYSAAIKPKSWAGTRAQYKSCDYYLNTDKSQQLMFNYSFMWYFPHDCLNVNLLDK